ncbi:LysR family transcriptional regulator [Clostridium botulinum]|nr:LysR family transcriptional regulator [Clostridium botulinum]
MNLQQLEYFIAIAKTKNFTTAANILSVTQPAISKSISKLEKELETPLFERDGRNIKLNKFGEVFLKYAELAIFNIDKGIEELKGMQMSNEKNISISSTECIGATFIPFVLSDFLHIKSNVKFEFHNSYREKILIDLKYGKIDFGFFDDIEDIEEYSDIEVILVKKDKYVLIVPKGHHLSNKTEVSLKDLKDELFVVFNKGCDNKKISYSEFIDYTPKISVQPSEASMLGTLVAAGAGITIVPNTHIFNTNKISILNIKEDIGYKTIYMGWNKKSFESKIIKEFRDYIIDSYLE